MSIDDLLLIVPPPVNLDGAGTLKDWQDVEYRLGIRFPADYKAIVDLYGVAVFSGELTIFSPFASIYGSNLIYGGLQSTLTLRDRLYGKDAFPYSFFPELPGLLSCGWSSYFQGGVFWLVSRESCDWPIVISGPDYPMNISLLNCNLLELLIKLCSNRIDIPCWGISSQ